MGNQQTKAAIIGHLVGFAIRLRVLNLPDRECHSELPELRVRSIPAICPHYAHIRTRKILGLPPNATEPLRTLNRLKLHKTKSSESSERLREVRGSVVLVAPQGTTSHDSKGDMVFSTVFPKFFPKRILRMYIPVYCTSTYFFVLSLCNRTKRAGTESLLCFRHQVYEHPEPRLNLRGRSRRIAKLLR